MTGSGIYEVLDERFRPCANGDGQLEVLYDRCRWAEGPIYVPAWRQLIWSDIPNDRLLRWDEATESVGVFRSPAGYVNGNTLDRDGRLVSCEQGNRRVTRTEHDGSITVLADRFEGKRLNSPNDATVKSDGSIWFSDPDFGITSDYEGHRGESEIGACNVYRIDPGSRRGPARGRGAARARTGWSSPRTSSGCWSRTAGPSRSRRSPCALTARWARARSVVECPAGNDNIRLDDEGRIWVGAFEDGVNCFAPDGTLIGKIRVPEIDGQHHLRRRQAQPDVHRGQHDALLGRAVRDRRRPDSAS